MFYVNIITLRIIKMGTNLSFTSSSSIFFFPLVISHHGLLSSSEFLALSIYMEKSIILVDSFNLLPVLSLSTDIFVVKMPLSEQESVAFS